MTEQKTLIKEITKVNSKGVCFTLTHGAKINGHGVTSKSWFTSWDKIGSALFGDQYSDEQSLKDLRTPPDQK